MHSKAAYVEALIIQSDLNHLDNILRNPQLNPLEALRFLRYMLVVLKNFDKSLCNTESLVRGNQDIIERKRTIRKSLEHSGKLRDKISGHIDKEVLKALINNEPILFYANFSRKAQSTIASSKLIEIALNTYISKDGNQVIFGHDIDFMYPPDYREFLRWMENLVTEAIQVNDLILQELDKHIKRVESEEELMKQYMQVGLGTFQA